MPRHNRTQNEAAVMSKKNAPRTRQRRRHPAPAYSVGRPSRALSAALVIMMLAAQTPAAPLVLRDVGSRLSWGVSIWLQTGGPESVLRALWPAQSRAGKQQAQEARDAKVVRLRVSPEQVSVPVGGQVFFNAVAFDRDGATVGGVSFKWEATDLGPGNGALISPDGVFSAVAPGRFRVTAQGAGKREQVEVTVADPSAGGEDRRPRRGGNLSTRELPQASVNSSKPGARPQPRRRLPRSKGVVTFTGAAFTYPGGGAPAPGSAPAPLGGEDPYGWNNSNYATADDPGGQVGDPPGAPADGGAGSGNYHITAPLLALPGRGTDLGLSLVYNAHLWHKEGTNITYDIDRGWPAPGWSLGFGKMVDIGNGGTLIIEPDGTRHGFNGTIYPGGGVSFFTGHTTDGSFIDYDCTVGSAGVQVATAKLRDGTVIYYAAPGAGAVYPTRITDPNGNYITVTYRNNSGPQIDTVTDTLGRVITFKYDANNLLTSVTAPGLGGGAERVLARLHYQQMNVNASFSGLTTKVRDAWPWQLDAVYYPATGTGYWFGESDSYVASYGMIGKVIEQRGMVFSGDVTQPDMGSVTQGTMTKQAVYHWLTPASDSPSYDTLTETWDGMDTEAAVTTYDVRTNDSPRTATVTLPGGVRTVQYSYNAPGQYNDGLVFRDETYDTDHTTLVARSTAEWQQGNYESPRPSLVTATTRAKDDAEITTGTEFTYAASPSYNQVVEVRNYDYGYVYGGGANVLLRRTVTQYENSSNYTAHHVFNLPKVVDVYGGDGVRASRTEYQYDGATLQNTPGVVQHADAYNPYAPQQWVPTYCYPTGCGMGGCSGQTCVQGHYETSYKTETNYRGNVTQVTTYSNAAAEPAAGAVTETHTYDIDGNMLTSSSSCCEQTGFGFAAATQYAYPTSTTRGATDPNSPTRVTTGATYDFNTGLLMTQTDPDGRTSSMSYFASSLRPQEDVLPTGGRTTYAYDDAAMTVTTATLLAAGGPVVGKSRSYLNGMGQVKRVESLGGWEASTWDASVLNVVDTKYDVLGRVWKESRPYRKGVEPGDLFTTNTYDVLGRVLSIESPDGSVARAFYNDLDPAHPRPGAAGGAPGETTLLVDEWGRERWGRTDSQGRLVEVVEPDPDGNGSVTTGGLLTAYSYDTLGNLTDVVQGPQHRRFAYDSLGRLTRQKLAETDAVFDDAGQYVGPGHPNAVWGDLFEYDSRSNLVSRTDARNVRTKFWYQPTAQSPLDPLNRLFKIEYVVQTGSVAAADTVNYAFETAGDLAKVKSITTKDPSTDEVRTTEEYRYDTQARVDQRTLTIAARPYHPLVTNFTFDSLDRITDVIHPAQYPSAARKTVHHDYDPVSRLSNLTVDGAAYASQFVYNASGQTKELKVGAAGANQVTEKYAYDQATGLLAGQKAYRGANENQNRLLDLSYDYLRAGTTGGRTGQLTKITDNLNAQKGRAFTYDRLGRLKRAAGGDPSAAALWTQDYSYDRWGNRTGTAAAGNTAALKAPADPSVKAPDVELASNSLPQMPEYLREKSGRAVTDAPAAPLLSSAAARVPAAAFTPAVPSAVAVTASSAAQISLSWNAPAGGADHYEVERGQSLAGPYTFAGTTQGTTFNDTAVAGGVAYLYRVRAVDIGGGRSAPSNVALGAAFTFADEPVNAGVTMIRAQHVNELRQAVNAVRAVAGLAAATWTDPTLTPQVTVIRAAHIQELRDRLNEALAALQIATTPFTDPVLATGSGGTAVRKAHVDELRQRASRGQSTSGGGSTSAPVPRDGFDALSYNQASNRISSDGWEYDAAGNQTRVKVADNVWQRYEYDAAGRLVAVKTDGGAVIASYTYCYSRQRLTAVEGSIRTYYAWGVAGVVAEYAEAVGASSPQWSKSYVYVGGRLLATQRPNGSGGELVEYHHQDRLGTRVVSNNVDATYYEQTTLPYGTALGAESTGESNRRFTSYDRSNATGLDYAVNRSYDARQGRFTQVDPLGAGASRVNDPQTWNLYAYCGNDPVNRTDRDGLFWGKLFRAIGKVLHFLYKVVMWATVALVTAVAIINPTTGWIIFAALMWLYALGGPTVRKILGIAGGIAAIYQQPPQIIFNLRGTVEATRQVVLPWLSYLGPINAFLFNSSGSGVQDEVDTAYEDSMKRLENKDCRTLIQGNSSVDPRDALRQIKAKNNIKYGGQYFKDDKGNKSEINGHTDGFHGDATITLFKSIFSKRANDAVVLLSPRPPNFTGREARSLVLLHELRHAGYNWHNGTLGDETWNDQILKACFGYSRNVAL
jgi:RHS repeat-associated protein